MLFGFSVVALVVPHQRLSFPFCEIPEEGVGIASLEMPDPDATDATEWLA
jgi:hypothetical protein